MMLVCSTHTHSGPSLNTRSEAAAAYYKLFVAGVAESIIKAHAALRPAAVGAAAHPLAEEVFNRRWYLKPGKMPLNPFGRLDKVKMNPGTSPDVLDRPAGPTDPDITIISVQDAKRKPLALFANYSLHYVGGAPGGQISADYFGEFARVMPSRVRGDESFVAMMSNGTSGDINNIPFGVTRPPREPDPDDAWADQVRVLTLHKAKGLEFPVVFMVGLVQGRFPAIRRPDPIELPEALIRDILPEGNYHLQEERRLFYVGMTRAKDTLYLTCAYDYGGKSVRKMSQFAVEALQLASPSPGAKQASARELIERSRPPKPMAAARRGNKATGPLRLDPHGANDFLTCPLKYRYSQVLRLPVMRNHLVIYGAAMHKAIEAFFQARLQGREMPEAELLETFDQHWSAQGFLTRTHEDLRHAQGHDTLRRFFARQQEAPEHPALIEQKFSFPLDDLLVVGRLDRVDRDGDAAVIIDYKTSEVTDQATADRKTRESLQLLIYALAWQTIHGRLPARLELRFLESGFIGQHVPDEDDLDKAREALRKAAAGIRIARFPAKPQEHACRMCAFQAICPSAFHTR